MFHGALLQAAQQFSLLKNKLQITDARFVGNIIVWLVGATTMMARHVHNIELQTLMEKMIKSLNSLWKEPNSSNVQGAIAGWKEQQGVARWHVGVDMNFVMIVEEVIVHMEHANIEVEKKNDYA